MANNHFSRQHSPSWSDFILDNLAHGLFTVDSSLRITYLNPMAEQILGYTSSESMGRFCGEILRGGMCGGACPLRTVLNQEQSSVSTETTIRTKDDQAIPIMLRTSAMFNEQGQMMGAVESFMDISQVKALEAQRNQTLSFFAHDMKSPLVTVAGFLNRLLEGKAGEVSEKQRTYLDIIQKEISRVQSLVLDFLDIAQLTRDETTRLITTSVDLAQLLGELGRVYQERARLKDLEFTADVDTSLPHINADPHRLNRVFANLLDNAVKFSDQGRIELRAGSGEPGSIRVEVLDQGPGFSPQDLAELFTPFHRGSAAEGIEGTGLGMAAVKAIVEAHAGEVKVENRAQGGAKVMITLPVPSDDIPPEVSAKS